MEKKEKKSKTSSKSKAVESQKHPGRRYVFQE